MQIGDPTPSSPRRGAADGWDCSLARYFDDVSALRVLTGAQEREVARRFRMHRHRVHELLAGLPATGLALCDRWRLHRRRANPFLGLLAPSAGVDPEHATHQVEGTVCRVGRRLDRTPPAASDRAASGAAWDRFESLQRADLLALDLSADFYREVEQSLRRSLCELGAAASAEARQQVRDAVRLPLRRLQMHIRTLEPLATAREEARNELARHNLRLVIRFAKEFQNLGVDFPDLIQEGNVGLLRAVDLFEPERGLKFSTYAVWWIRQSLVRAIQKQSRTVRLPSHVNDRLHRMNRASERLSGRLGRSPTEAELARETGFESARVEHLRSLHKTPLSLDQTANHDGSRLRHELLPDAQAASPLEHLDTVWDREAVRALLSRLDERERAVIGRRFGFSGENHVSLHRLADELGLSREWVRRIEKRALSKLRAWAEGARLNHGRTP